MVGALFVIALKATNGCDGALDEICDRAESSSEEVGPCKKSFIIKITWLTESAASETINNGIAETAKEIVLHVRDPGSGTIASRVGLDLGEHVIRNEVSSRSCNVTECNLSGATSSPLNTLLVEELSS